MGGKLAQVGSRLVDAAARKMADEFFAAFSAHLNPPGEETEAASEEGAAAPVEYEQSGTWKIWVIAFLVLGGAIILAL